MAEKRITTVDEVMTVDENADYVLISRGVQKDLKRLLVRRFPQDFDLHDHVTDRLTTLAGIDRLLVSDEGAPGAPQKYVTLATLRSFLLDLFDLHDDVPDELTEPANNDRLLISDEDERGDPQKWISVENLAAKITANAMQFETLSTEHTPNTNILVTENHKLGKPPAFVSPVLVCKTAEHGYSVGDEVTVAWWGRWNGSLVASAVMAIVSATNTQVTIAFNAASSVRPIPIPNKTTGVVTLPNASKWKMKFSIAG